MGNHADLVYSHIPHHKASMLIGGIDYNIVINKIKLLFFTQHVETDNSPRRIIITMQQNKNNF